MTRIANTGALRQRQPRQRDSSYLRWLLGSIRLVQPLPFGHPDRPDTMAFEL